MKFDFNSIHTIYESDNEDSKNPVVNDQSGANIDNTLGSSDLLSMYDDICPISGDVYAAMKDAAKDPSNLKLTAIKNGDGESKLFVEAVEFATFIEANGYTIGEGAESVLEYVAGDTPELNNAEFHVVFPCDALNKNILGGENLGVDTSNDWCMQLIRGCRRYGLKVNVGKDNDPLTEAFYTSFKDKVSKASENIKKAKEDNKLQKEVEGYSSEKIRAIRKSNGIPGMDKEEFDKLKRAATIEGGKRARGTSAMSSYRDDYNKEDKKAEREANKKAGIHEDAIDVVIDKAIEAKEKAEMIKNEAKKNAIEEYNNRVKDAKLKRYEAIESEDK